MRTVHWLTRFDPDDGEPYGAVCDCEIGVDHTAAEMEEAFSSESLGEP
jgi:hypothetical protein